MTEIRVCDFGYCVLRFICNLVLGIWSLKIQIRKQGSDLLQKGLKSHQFFNLSDRIHGIHAIGIGTNLLAKIQ